MYVRRCMRESLMCVRKDAYKRRLVYVCVLECVCMCVRVCAWVCAGVCVGV
jgi:hypothetical protein